MRLDEHPEGPVVGLFDAVGEKAGGKLGKVAQPIRVALTGGTVSPGLFEVMEVLGKDEVLKRLSTAVRRIGS